MNNICCWNISTLCVSRTTKIIERWKSFASFCALFTISNWSAKVIRTKKKSFMNFKAVYTVLWIIRTWDYTWRHSWGKHCEFFFTSIDNFPMNLPRRKADAKKKQFWHSMSLHLIYIMEKRFSASRNVIKPKCFESPSISIKVTFK